MTTSADASPCNSHSSQSVPAVGIILMFCAYLFLVNFNLPGSMDWMMASGSASVNQALTRHFASALNDAGIVSVTPPALDVQTGVVLLFGSTDGTIEYRDRQGRLQTAPLVYSAGGVNDWLRVRDGKVRYWALDWPHPGAEETKQMALYKQASWRIRAAIDAVRAKERTLGQWHAIEGAPDHGQ